jgi:hypothetical protein
VDPVACRRKQQQATGTSHPDWAGRAAMHCQMTKKFQIVVFVMCLLPSLTLPSVITPSSQILIKRLARNQNVLHPGLLRLFGGDSGGDSGKEKGDIPENAPAGCPGTASAEAGKQDSCQGCPNQSACASGAGASLDPDKLAAKIRMEGVRYKLLVLSGKGGVGKSTLATQLAMALSANGDLTGLLDIDICGPSIPRMVGVEGEEVRQVLRLPEAH